MSNPNPAPYEYALALLCDLHLPAPCPAVPPVTAFVANLFQISLDEVRAAVVERLADRERAILAEEAQREGQPEADIYGDNALEG